MIEQKTKSAIQAEDIRKRLIAQGFRVQVLWDGECFTVKGVRHA